MACPFFLPTEKVTEPGWDHPARLPLGGGWSGTCSAPGHDGERPSDRELMECCNLGYAIGCPRLPHERSADAVRFAIAGAGEGRIRLRYVC